VPRDVAVAVLEQAREAVTPRGHIFSCSRASVAAGRLLIPA
jgi:hypothetical protein